MPIPLQQRVPENAPGDFYVSAGTCMRCCLPHDQAPELMNDCKVEFRECYFRRQPTTQDEVERAIQAIRVSEVRGLRYGGQDQAIIRRLYELHCEDYCDHPLADQTARPHLNAWLPTLDAKQNLWQRLLAMLGFRR